MTMIAKSLLEQSTAADKPRYELHFHACLEGAVVDDYNNVKTIIKDSLTRPIAEPLHQLPPDLANFTGRQAELKSVISLLRANQGAEEAIAILTGMAGVGKSALAIHAADQLKPDFPDAQLYINLRGTESQPLEPVQVLASFIRSLAGNDQLIPKNLTERSNFYRSLLANKRVLVVLDNALDEAQVCPLLPENSTCATMITTRKSFADLNGAATLELDVMTEQEALLLLQKWVGSDRLQAQLDAAKNIIDLCSRLPLALCIVGGTLKNRPDWRLEECVQRLTEERQRLLPRRLSDLAVRVSLALSYQELDATTARLFRLLGLLTSPNFTPALATVLLESDPATADQSVQHLVNVQLLELASGGRYRFHDLVRLNARGELAKEEPSEARQAARLRISRWYLETSKIIDLALNPETSRQLAQVLEAGKSQSKDATHNQFRAALNWFELERTNLLASIEWAHQGKSWEIVASLAKNLVNFFNIYAYWGDWEQTHLLALEATHALEESVDNFEDTLLVRRKGATTLANLGNVYSLSSDWQHASECYEKSLGIFQEQENRLDVAKIIGNLANVYSQAGNWAKASDFYQQSLNMFAELNDHYGEGQTLANLGILWVKQNQEEKAIALWQEALVKLPSDSPKSKQLKEWLSNTKVTVTSNAPSSRPPAQPPVLIVRAVIIVIAIALFLIFLIY